MQTAIQPGDFERRMARQMGRALNRPNSGREATAGDSAFTLLEVMIAAAIFFMATFAMLALVGQNIRAAQVLTRNNPHAGMLASELILTNRVEEGFEQGDFGEFYERHNWTREIVLLGTNGLFQVDFTVFHDGEEESRMSIWLFRPESANAAGGRR